MVRKQPFCVLPIAFAVAAPLRPREFAWLPIVDVKPQGWLLRQERIQADTLGGHLQEFFLNGSQWVGGAKPNEILEMVPYWLYGLVPLAVQLGDEPLLAVVRSYVSAILDRQLDDGWMGPWNESTGTEGKKSRDPWPRYRLLSVLADYADAFNDTRTIPGMHLLVRRLRATLNATTGKTLRSQYPWAHSRWQELVASIQYLVDLDPFDRLGDQAELLDIAALARKTGLDWASWYKSRLCANASDTLCFPCREAKALRCQFAASPYFCQHGVNVAQSMKFWASDWRGGVNPTAAADARDALQRLEHCHGQPGAVLSAHEVVDGIEPARGTETCHVVEMMDSYGELFATFGDVSFADRLEVAAFNRLPAAYFNGSMWALQYFHQTNAVDLCNGYGLPFECCVTNGNQGWPMFTAHIFARHADGIAVVLYAPSDLDTTLPNGNRVKISVSTSYPFAEDVNLSIVADASFPLWLRIPSWAKGGTLSGTVVEEGTLHHLNVSAGQSSLSLRLPLQVRVESAKSGGVTVHAGPLLFALDLAPEEDKHGCYFPPDGCHYGLRETPPASRWRRALVLDANEPSTGGLRLEKTSSSTGANERGAPFARASAPLRIRATGRALPPEAWELGSYCTSMEKGCSKCMGPVPQANVSQVAAVEDSEMLLLPFGATDVRVAVMPAFWRDAVISV